MHSRRPACRPFFSLMDVLLVIRRASVATSLLMLHVVWRNICSHDEIPVTQEKIAHNRKRKENNNEKLYYRQINK